MDKFSTSHLYSPMPISHEIPPRITPKSDNEYFEQLTKAVFQAGFSWPVIRQKWDHFKVAFDRFKIRKVADYGIEDLHRLMDDSGIVRNGRKIKATIENARTMRHLVEKHGSFKAYLEGLEGDYYERSRILTDQFNHLGRTGVFVFLFCVNEEVPPWEER